MDKQHDQPATRPDDTLESRLGEIARATSPPPARLPDSGPANIPATTSDSNVVGSLVLGIISLCFFLLPWCAFPAALLGLIIGLVADKHAKGSARTGITLSAIGLGLSLIVSIIYLLRAFHL